mgnify:CR=1 FL=1
MKAARAALGARVPAAYSCSGVWVWCGSCLFSHQAAPATGTPGIPNPTPTQRTAGSMPPLYRTYLCGTWHHPPIPPPPAHTPPPHTHEPKPQPPTPPPDPGHNRRYVTTRYGSVSLNDLIKQIDAYLAPGEDGFGDQIQGAPAQSALRPAAHLTPSALHGIIRAGRRQRMPPFGIACWGMRAAGAAQPKEPRMIVTLHGAPSAAPLLRLPPPPSLMVWAAQAA